MTITFKDLRDICYRKEYLTEYVNSFSGGDIYEKFINILKTWERDVSYDIGFNFNDKNVKVGMDYFLSEFESYDNSDLEIIIDDIKFIINIPEKFDEEHDFFNVEKYVKKISYKNFEISGDFEDVLKELPPRTYNELIKNILQNEDKTITFSNKALEGMTINFFTNVPLQILEGLFASYNKEYFRDVIYYLSKKIDARFLMESTMFDIEYYIEKMGSENPEPQIPNLA